MIDFEQTIMDLFKHLPALSSRGGVYNPVFDYGTEDQMIRFLKIRELKQSRYPLIWMETPIRTKGKEYVTVNNFSLILATKSNPENTNEERQFVSFESLLNPLVENVLKCFDQASNTEIVSSDEDLERTKFFNYLLADGKNKYEDWDAIKLTFDLRVTKTCKTTKIHF